MPQMAQGLPKSYHSNEGPTRNWTVERLFRQHDKMSRHLSRPSDRIDLPECRRLFVIRCHTILYRTFIPMFLMVSESCFGRFQPGLAAKGFQVRLAVMAGGLVGNLNRGADGLTPDAPESDPDFSYRGVDRLLGTRYN